jgi:heptaprenyl diphosphate synthase
MGAYESGCDEKIIESLKRLGYHIGHIFQIRDDLIDFESDEQHEGKPVHVDFRGGIFTLPVLYALQHQTHGKALRELIIDCRQREIIKSDIATMETLVKQSGGISFAKEHIVNHAQMAYKILEGLPGNEGLTVIKGLVKWISSVEKNNKR